MVKFEQLEGSQIALNKSMGVMGTKINDLEANANLKFESLEKRLDQHDLAINEITNVKGVPVGGVVVFGRLGGSVGVALVRVWMWRWVGEGLGLGAVALLGRVSGHRLTPTLRRLMPSFGNGKYENEEGQNKGGGGERPQAPQEGDPEQVPYLG